MHNFGRIFCFLMLICLMVIAQVLSECPIFLLAVYISQMTVTFFIVWSVFYIV